MRPSIGAYPSRARERSERNTKDRGRIRCSCKDSAHFRDKASHIEGAESNVESSNGQNSLRPPASSSPAKPSDPLPIDQDHECAIPNELWDRLPEVLCNQSGPTVEDQDEGAGHISSDEQQGTGKDVGDIPPLSDTDQSVEESSCSENDGEGEWITPGNVELHKARALQLLPEAAKGNRNGKMAGADQPVVVGCMTTDFAMQNVLLQMGLSLINTDGRRIQKVKNWVLRCHACFK